MIENEPEKIAGTGVVATGDEKSHGAGCSRVELAAATTKANIWYACQRCGNCCRWPGFVRLTEADIAAISRFLGLSEDTFIQSYTRLRPRRDGLALIDQEGGACVFLDGIDCRIQSVKPEQCRGFPNAWNFPGWRDVCEAIAVVREETPDT